MRVAFRIVLACMVAAAAFSIRDARAFVTPSWKERPRWTGRYHLIRWRYGNEPMKESPNTFVKIDDDRFSWSNGEEAPYATSPFHVRSVFASEVVMDFTEREGYAELRLLADGKAHLDYLTPTTSEFELERVVEP